MSWDTRCFKASLIKIKSLSTLALNQLENVELADNKLPDDPQVRDNLFSLFAALDYEWELAKSEYPDLCSAYQDYK